MSMEKFPLGDNSQKETEKNEILLKNLYNMLERASQEARKTGNLVSFMNSLADFALNLERKYPDARSRRLWHLLAHSTPGPEYINNMEDYPGEDSIARFIERLKPKEI